MISIKSRNTLVDILGFDLSEISSKPKLDVVDELDCWLVYNEDKDGWISPELIDEIDKALHRCTALPCTVSGVAGGVIRAPEWLTAPSVASVFNVVIINPPVYDV